MNKGQFEAQVNEIERLLKSHSLLQERNRFPDYGDCGVSLFNQKSYREVWEISFKEQWYDFMLVDHSLIQFKADFTQPCFNYAYYESPHRVPTYTDYLVLECGFAPEELSDIGDSFRTDYEVSLATSGLKEVFTPIRYDYDPERYVEGRHPASHIHVGSSNNLRIGARMLLKPMSFVLFVFRQCYPNIWMDLLESENDNILLRNVALCTLV